MHGVVDKLTPPDPGSIFSPLLLEIGPMPPVIVSWVVGVIVKVFPRRMGTAIVAPLVTVQEIVGEVERSPKVREPLGREESSMLGEEPANDSELIVNASSTETPVTEEIVAVSKLLLGTPFGVQ